jgi:hypothetical protein
MLFATSVAICPNESPVRDASVDSSATIAGSAVASPLPPPTAKTEAPEKGIRRKVNARSKMPQRQQVEPEGMVGTKATMGQQKIVAKYKRLPACSQGISSASTGMAPSERRLVFHARHRRPAIFVFAAAAFVAAVTRKHTVTPAARPRCSTTAAILKEGNMPMSHDYDRASLLHGATAHVFRQLMPIFPVMPLMEVADFAAALGRCQICGNGREPSDRYPPDSPVSHAPRYQVAAALPRSAACVATRRQRMIVPTRRRITVMRRSLEGHARASSSKEECRRKEALFEMPCRFLVAAGSHAVMFELVFAAFRRALRHIFMSRLLLLRAAERRHSPRLFSPPFEVLESRASAARYALLRC